MKRRGKCRCGAILQFQQTAQGYKTRCSNCGAIVRLRLDPGSKPRKQSSKASSGVLAAVGPPPLEHTDFSAPILPPSLDDAPPDFSVLSDHESDAPQALAEMETFAPPRAKGSALPWIVFGAL